MRSFDPMDTPPSFRAGFARVHWIKKNGRIQNGDSSFLFVSECESVGFDAFRDF